MTDGNAISHWIERVKAGSVAIDLDLGGEVRLPGGGRAGAAVGGAVALATGVWLLPKAEPPPPPRIEIAGATMERLRPENRDLAKDPYIARLLRIDHVEPASFRRHWGLLRTLTLQGRLPPEVTDTGRLERLFVLHGKDPDAACMGLEEVLEELREAVGS